ncbi:MAG: hypothetical protein IPL23_24045 [Saprospiraceae bacterium]|nr:hypothetical protein [Saprospiraceae bacterium]
MLLKQLLINLHQPNIFLSSQEYTFDDWQDYAKMRDDAASKVLEGVMLKVEFHVPNWAEKRRLGSGKLRHSRWMRL